MDFLWLFILEIQWIPISPQRMMHLIFSDFWIAAVFFFLNNEFKKKSFLFFLIHCLNLNIKTVFKEQSKQLEVTNKKQTNGLQEFIAIMQIIFISCS